MLVTLLSALLQWSNAQIPDLSQFNYITTRLSLLNGFTNNQTVRQGPARSSPDVCPDNSNRLHVFDKAAFSLGAKSQLEKAAVFLSSNDLLVILSSILFFSLSSFGFSSLMGLLFWLLSLRSRFLSLRLLNSLM
jgi:hypothetical protein